MEEPVVSGARGSYIRRIGGMAHAFFFPTHTNKLKFLHFTSLSAVNARISEGLDAHPTLVSFRKDFFRKKEKWGQKTAAILPVSGAILYAVQEVLIGSLLG